VTEILLDIADHIATITLNRPPVNAFSVSMMSELIDALRAVDESDDARVTILIGAGRCFSAGIDLKEQLTAIDTQGAGPGAMGLQLYEALLGGAKPTIAAINGPALGAGLGIAASCCILLASDTSSVGLPEIDVGMLGGARHAMRLLGHSTVNRMLLTGHQLSGSELYQRRVVEACLPGPELLPHARSIAAEIAAKDPVAVRLARQSLARVESMDLLEGYGYEMDRAQELGRTPGARAAMSAFLARRGPAE